MDFIESQKAKYPDLADSYDNLFQLFSQKLWHQLSVSLEDFLKLNNARIGSDCVELYKEFIIKFEGRLSQIRLALLVSIIGKAFSDQHDSIRFYDSILSSRSRLGLDASMCIDMDIVLAHVQLGQIDDAARILDEAKVKLAAISSTETVVYSKYYAATAQFRKSVGPPTEFYKAGLMYLAYTPIEDLPVDEKYILATDIALAATTGADIFNFGEVLATPILTALQGTPNEWLHDLVAVLNRGDIEGFNILVESFREKYFAQPALAARHEDIKKKIILLCLMNIVFERHSHDRTISFSDIASRTRIPVLEVEWVLMRAMSLGLIKGVVDETEQVVEVSWVRPRVLDSQQLELLHGQLGSWAGRVKNALNQVEDQFFE